MAGWSANTPCCSIRPASPARVAVRRGPGPPPPPPTSRGPAAPRGSRAGGSAAAGESAALQQKVTGLQSQLSESQRLLDLKNAELARLQTQIDRSKTAPETAPAQPPLPAPSTPAASTPEAA